MLDRAVKHEVALAAVAGVVATSETISEALDALLPTIGSLLQWDVGALWRVDEPAQRLRNVAFWRAPRASTPWFEALTRQLSFSSGVGLPGRVWASAISHSIANVAVEPNFPRAHAAKGDRLRSAYALPIRGRRDPVAVLEFYTCRSELAEPVALTMDAISSALATLARRR